MAKKKPKEDDGTDQVRVNADLARKAAAVVSWRKKQDKGFTMAVFLDPVLRPFVEAEFATTVGEMQADVKKPSK